ncbi:MAG: hypothetical protein MI919_18845 [Holophagales bacterium]|nr:hypothetical protein [Holophagales bacterium]
METPWKSTAAGIFDITAGICALAGAIVVALLALGSGGFFGFIETRPDTPTGAGLPFAVGVLLFGFVTLFLLALGGVATWGGIQAIRKESYGWSIAASIATMLVFFPVGLIAVVLTLMAETEFPARRAALESQSAPLEAPG